MNAQGLAAAKLKLGELDAWLDAHGQRLKILQFPVGVPTPAPTPPAPAPPPDPAPTALEPFDYIYQNGETLPKASSPKNIALALGRLQITPTYDEFAQQTLLVINDMTRRRQLVEPLNDVNEREIRFTIDERFRFLPPKELLREVLLNEANRKAFHPVRQYLDQLSRDGEPRLEHWLVTYAGAPDTEYVRQVSAIILIAGVRRVRVPGTKFDELVVFESDQGTEKSSALRALCPKPDWFSDCMPLDSQPKEVIEQTAGKWILEVAELSGIRGAAIEKLKAMLSRQVDSSRMAYGHHRIDAPRQWIAFGTTNDSEYLKDDTGNRRFWPITIKKFDVKGILANRDQLWAEAATREARGESIRLHERFWQDAAKEQEQRYTVDPWEDELRHHLEKYKWPNGLKRIARRDLFGWIGKNIAHARKADNMRLKAIMTRLGWKAMTVNTSGRSEQGYGCDE